MIELEIKGSFPVARKSVRKALHEAGKYMVGSVRKNFVLGGRPPWEATKSGDIPLTGTGKLFNSIRYKLTGETEVTISAGKGLKYAAIHQFGGVTHPQVTKKAKRFYLAKFLETKNPMWRAMLAKRIGERLNIRIPVRAYMMFQDQDIDYLVRLFEGFSIEFEGVKSDVGIPFTGTQSTQ